MLGAPPETRGMAEASFCVLSGNYMNFAVRTGYHFSTVDAWCGGVENRNYIHFHFSAVAPHRIAESAGSASWLVFFSRCSSRCEAEAI